MRQLRSRKAKGTLRAYSCNILGARDRYFQSVIRKERLVVSFTPRATHYCISYRRVPLDNSVMSAGHLIKYMNKIAPVICARRPRGSQGFALLYQVHTGLLPTLCAPRNTILFQNRIEKTSRARHLPSQKREAITRA